LPVIGTARDYAEQGLCNGIMSVRLSVTFASRTPLLRVCCCGPGKQEISIDCCQALSSSRAAAWRAAANAGSATLSADAGS